MRTVLEAIARFLRGSRVSRLLVSLGVNPRHYWLLMDLFGQLSERGEMLDELGRNGVALQTVAWIYAIFSGILSILMVLSQPAVATYFWTFQGLTAFLFLSVLVSEAGNSLVNPVEGLILAHQPINGATYTAAKLTHLVRIVLYLAPGLNAVPAFGGLMLKEATWHYPLTHLLAAFTTGLVAAFLCCALYGWLMRFVPARRLKAAGQLAASMPFVVMMLQRPVGKWFTSLGILQWWSALAGMRWALGLAAGAGALAIVSIGIRSLSADYLIRASSMMRGGSTAGTELRRSLVGEIVARWMGGQPARAGFAFVSRLARRDYQFRRQLIPLIAASLVGLLPLAAIGWRTDPFSGRFTTMHLVPHILGALLFIICTVLAYGTDFKGSWIFSLAPGHAFGPFACGVYASLCIQMILIPHAILILLLSWAWGVWHASLFVAYSLAVSLIYLALNLRRIEGAPFSKQVDSTRGATLLPLMIIGSIVAATAVGLQYILVFRSTATVMMVTAILSGAAYFLTRTAVEAFEGSIRYHLALLSAEPGSLYKEIDV